MIPTSRALHPDQAQSQSGIAARDELLDLHDLFEEPGPPTAPFQGGFGLLNPQGIRKPAFFCVQISSPLKARVSRQRSAGDGGHAGWKRCGCDLGFEQPEQKVSNRPFIQAGSNHARAGSVAGNSSWRLMPHTAWKCIAPAIAPTMRILRTSRMGMPRLSVAQLARLRELTRNLPETDTCCKAGGW